MVDWFTIGQWALGTLVLFLCASVGLRTWLAWRAQDREWRLRWGNWKGKGFDASAIAGEIQKVKEQPLAALWARRHPGFYRQELVAAARRWISQLSFFHDAKADHEPRKRDA